MARIWSARGELQRVLKRHNGTVFSLQWSPSGRHLLTGGVDRSSIVWDAERGEVAQQFTNHTAAVLDVAWRDDTSFVSCSSDKTIFAYELGRTLPVRHLIGHTNDVNAVEWDPTRTVLASCSDDKTARLWRLSQDQCLHTLSDHTKEIYSIQWSPACAAYSPILATASFDSYVKLWNPETGLVTNTLAMHTFVSPPFSLSLTPSHISSIFFTLSWFCAPQGPRVPGMLQPQRRLPGKRLARLQGVHLVGQDRQARALVPRARHHL